MCLRKNKKIKHARKYTIIIIVACIIVNIILVYTLYYIIYPRTPSIFFSFYGLLTVMIARVL